MIGNALGGMPGQGGDVKQALALLTQRKTG